jgi:hypothetical protein
MRAVVVFAVLGGLAILGAGIYRLVQNETGTRVDVKVSDCSGVDTRYTHETCTGSWVIGGSLLAGGHVVVGVVNGAHAKDIGKTVRATVRGDTAYTLGLLLPILLISFGVLIAGGSAFLVKLVW